MAKKWLTITLLVIISVVLVACNKDESVENTNEDKTNKTENTEETTENEVPSLDEHQTKQLIKNFREVVTDVFAHANNDGEVKNYQSKEELTEAFTKYMSENQAQSFSENYFEEDNGTLYVLGMDAPFWIDEEKEFVFEQLDDTKYEVRQEIENELAGHLRLIYVIVLEDEDWIVKEVRSEEITEENTKDKEQGKDNNSSTSNQESNNEGTDETEQTDQKAPEKEEGPEDESKEESNGEITKKKAEELVRKHLNIEENSGIHVVMDHLDDNGNYVVQVYEVVSDGDVGHTATMGWYIVDKKDGSIEEMM